MCVSVCARVCIIRGVLCICVYLIIRTCPRHAREWQEWGQVWGYRGWWRWGSLRGRWETARGRTRGGRHHPHTALAPPNPFYVILTWDMWLVAMDEADCCYSLCRFLLQLSRTLIFLLTTSRPLPRAKDPPFSSVARVSFRASAARNCHRNDALW